MKRLFIAFVLLMQGGGQPTNIPIPITAFTEQYGSNLRQDLGVSPAHFQEYQPGYTIDGVYTLTLSEGNGFPSYPGYYKAELDFGTQELCEHEIWGTHGSQVTFSCPSPGYLIVDKSLSCDQNPCSIGPAQGNANLALTVSVNGWPVSSTDISLTFTPE